jgi:hypothetical protein
MSINLIECNSIDKAISRIEIKNDSYILSIDAFQNDDLKNSDFCTSIGRDKKRKEIIIIVTHLELKTKINIKGNHF